MLSPEELFLLNALHLGQENEACQPMVANIVEDLYFAENMKILEEDGFIKGKDLLPKGFNSIHTNPQLLTSKQNGFRLIETIKTLYTRKDFSFVNFIPFHIKTKLLDSLVASLNSQPTDVVAEFQRTLPKEEVVVESVQETVEVEAVVKPKRKAKKGA